MRKIAFFALFLTLVSGRTIRHFLDNVGFCTKPAQIEAIVKIATALEGKSLLKESSTGFFAVISPHDDHMYAGRIYVHAISKIARAKTIVIFAVTHHKARVALNDPKNILIFDDYDMWEAPYFPIKVNTELRTHLESSLERNDFIVSRKAQDLEHSAEAMVPFIQYYNRNARILTIMVTEMSFWRMKALSNRLAKAFISYMKENHLRPGKDIAFIISTDTTHYGPDFNYSPFGLSAAAHQKAIEQDKDLGKRFLSGKLTEEKIRFFADRVWGEKIPWCGRFSVPFGTLTLVNLARLNGKTVVGIPLRYGDSYSLGVLPTYRMGIGLTAPFSLKHWVGYWAIGYKMK